MFPLHTGVEAGQSPFVRHAWHIPPGAQNGLAGSLQSAFVAHAEQQPFGSQCLAQSESAEHEQKTHGVLVGLGLGLGATHDPDPSHVPILHGSPVGLGISGQLVLKLLIIPSQRGVLFEVVLQNLSKHSPFTGGGQSESVKQDTQFWLLILHKGVAPEQSESETHSTQLPEPTSQTGRVISVHCVLDMQGAQHPVPSHCPVHSPSTVHGHGQGDGDTCASEGGLQDTNKITKYKAIIVPCAINRAYIKQ